MKKINVLVLGLAILMTVSCGKEKEVQPQNNPGSVTTSKACLPVKYEFNEVYGPAVWEFEYNANSQVSGATYRKVNGSGGMKDVIFYSKTGKITMIKRYIMPAKELSDMSRFLYNADSLVGKEIWYKLATPGDSASLVPASEQNFVYDTAKRLVRVNHSPYQSSLINSYNLYNYSQQNSFTHEQYGGNPIMISWRDVIHFIPNSKAPGSDLVYFNLPPLNIRPSGIIKFGLLPATLEETQFFQGAQVAQKTFSYSYVYNAEGYPTEQTISFPGQQPMTNYWTYNCQ